MADETTSYNADDFDKGFAAYEAGDYVEAVKWCRKAAMQGHAMAQFSLGQRYANGKGVAEDDKQAVQWTRKAAEQGLAKAQYALGYMYANGEGVLKDDVTAYGWFNIAATNGYEIAKTNHILAKRMTPDQIGEAESLVKEMIEKNPKLIQKQ